MSKNLSPGRRFGGVFLQLAIWSLVWFGLALIVASVGVRFLFGKISVDQLILNLVAVQAGSGSGGELVWLGVLAIGVLPLGITVLLAISRAKHIKKHPFSMTARGRAVKRTVRSIAILLTAMLGMFGVTAFASTIKFADYVRSGRSSADLGEYYATPNITEKAHKRNLVLIYLESGEESLGDADTFEKDMLAPVKEATEGWASIDGLQQYAGGGWTMAGIVSTQCGIPLKGKITASGGEILQELTNGLESYLPGERCLGEVLSDNGYRNVFFGGSDTSFAAKDMFLSDHGYTRVIGLADWRVAGEREEDIRADWGLSDERLMEHAKTEVSNLHADAERTGQPFNLTMLTLDTHEPAHVYDSCEVDTEQQMTSVYACSMTAVAGFIDYMRDEGYLDDTAVVVMGDHLKQLGGAGAFHAELEGRTDRTIFNRIWLPDSPEAPPLRSDIDQLSMYPTLLEITGLTLQNHRAGLGVSALTATIPPDSALALNPSQYRELLRSRSGDFYRNAWGELK